MDKSSGKKKIKLIITIVIIIAVIVPFCPYLWMRFNVLRNMKRIYKNAKFVNFSCDRKPIPEDHLDSYIWYGGEQPEGPLYAFTIEDSEGNNGWGYARKDGTVVMDNYSGKYYLQDTIDYFERVVDFKTNFPEIECTPIHVSPENTRRLVYTEDCTTFEGYLKARLVGSMSLTGHGFSGIDVGLNTDDPQYVYDINQILRQVDFEVCVEYMTTDETVTDEDLRGVGDELGHYYPFGSERYETAILGDKSQYDRMKESDKQMFVIEITNKGTLSQSYILYYDGSIMKKDYRNGSEDRREISDEDYAKIYRFASGIHYDTGKISITSGDEDSDRLIKVKLYSYWTRNDGKEMHYEDVLYSVDEPDENLSPIMDLMDGYFE